MNDLDTILLTITNGTNTVELRTNRSHDVYSVVCHTPEGDKDHGTYMSEPFAYMIYAAVVKTFCKGAA